MQLCGFEFVCMWPMYGITYKVDPTVKPLINNSESFNCQFKHMKLSSASEEWSETELKWWLFRNLSMCSNWKLLISTEWFECFVPKVNARVAVIRGLASLLNQWPSPWVFMTSSERRSNECLVLKDNVEQVPFYSFVCLVVHPQWHYLWVVFNQVLLRADPLK